MLVTSGATVEEIWDYKVDGKSLDNMLAICGQYVDFAPKYSPHFVCPAIVQQHPKFPLFQMSYESLFNSKKWPSDSSNGPVTPTLWLSHSVKLLYVLSEYPFSNIDCSGLD